MDFFKDVQNKLKELEDQANQMQQAEMHLRQEQKRVGGGAGRKKALFQPKKATANRQHAPEFRSSKREKPAGTVFTHHDPNFKHHQAPKAGTHIPIDPKACLPKESQAVEISPRGESIFDNLDGRLDEAFLLQEILGTPMCMRAEFED